MTIVGIISAVRITINILSLPGQRILEKLNAHKDADKTDPPTLETTIITVFNKYLKYGITSSASL